MSSSDSSFSSSLASSFGASAAAAGAPPAAGAEPAAGAPPPAPTFERRSFTFLPSRALASSVAQIGSSSTLAALVSVTILSDWDYFSMYGPGAHGMRTDSDFNAIVAEDEGSVGGCEFDGGL
jgi:hypothetical protein